MKTRIYAVVILLTTVMMSLYATDITFDGKQKLYFNSATTWPGFAWNKDDAVFSAYFYKGTTGLFAEKAEQIDGNVYAVTVPEGTWSDVIFTRHEKSTTIFDFDAGHGFWSESRPIPLKQYQWDNYVSEFKIKGDASDTYYTWNQLYSEQPKDGVTPATLATNWGLTIEDIPVCNNSTGDPFTLTPNTRETSGGKYEYNYDMRAHAWFKTTNNGTTWTSVDGLAGIRASALEGDDFHYNDETVGAYESVTYYYLYAKESNDQRLIRVSVDKDCDITCEITSFEVTPTAVNVGDNTYTMDGIVAFTKAEGSLIIECDGKKTTIASPVSPQTFSLPGLAADGGAEDFRAYFSLDGSCEMYNHTTAPSPTTDAITHPEVTIAPKETITLTPDADGTDDWEWTLKGSSTILKNTGTNEFVVPEVELDHDAELMYVYTEYDPQPTLPTNIMENGNFEDVTYYTDHFKWKTEYKNSNVLNSNQIWDGGSGRKDIYDLSAFKDTYGYFGVTTNANTYWKLMSHINPKDGSYLAVIDGDEEAGKKAWYAETGTDNPNLTLLRGTTYLFSFWVTNINNFGELINNGRKNCAILQFHIKCHSVEDDTWYEADLGDPIDLNDDKYLNFNWHQNSSTFSTRNYFGKDFNADKVTISVVDKNSTGLTIGNDFALDDIQFRPISILSRHIKAREFFKVKVFEEPCTFSNMKIDTIRPKCSDTKKDKYSLKVTLNYDKPQGSLTLTDNGTVIYSAATVSELTEKIIIIDDLPADGESHTLKAKFTKLDGLSVDKGCHITGTYTAPGVPALSVTQPDVPAPGCNVVTYDLDVTTTYAYQNGSQLLFYWDGILKATQDITYGASTSTTVTLTELPYDGEDHTLLVKTNNEKYDCTDSKTVHSPHQPVINSVSQSLEPDYVCGEDQYHVTLTVNYTNGLEKKICVKEGTKELKSVTANTSAGTKTTKITDLNFDFDTDHNLKVYFEGHETCAEDVVVKSPAKPKVTAEYSVINKGCSKTTYDLEVTVHYINQNGTPHVDVDGKAAETYSPDVKKNQPEERSIVAVVKNLPADGGSAHKLNVSFNESHGCSLDPIILTGIPHQPVINSITKSNPAYICGENQYYDTLKVNYTNALGDKICVKEGTEVIKSVAAYTGDDNKEADILLDFDFDTDHNLKVYFEGHETCAEEVVVKSPVKPALSATYKVVNTACDKTTYDLEVTVKYTNQNGKLHVDVDGKAAKEPKPDEITENSTDELTYVAVVKDLPADEGTAHTLNVSFSGDHGCHPDPIILTGIPHRPVINSITQSCPAYVCGENQYHDTLKVTYTNALGKKICIKEGTEVIKSVAAYTGADKKSTTIPLDLDFDADHNLKVYFGGHEECAEELTVVSPAKPALTVTPNVIKPDCDVTTYSLRLKLNYTNQRGATIYANVDGGTDVTKANAFVSVMESKEDSIQIDGLSADGNSHKFNLHFDDDDCDALNVAFNAPFGPKISGVTITPDTMKCGETAYKVTVAATLSANAIGKTLTVTGDTGESPTTYTVTSTSFSHQFTINKADATGKFRIYFADAENCESQKTKDYTYTVPTIPTFSVNPVTVPTPDCDVTTFDLSISGTYSNLHGNQLEFWWDGVKKTTQSIAPLSSGKVAATISGVVYDGKTHELTVKSNNTVYDNCPEVQNVSVPFSPSISGMEATPTQMKCGVTTYDVKVTFTVVNGQGKKVTVSGKGQTKSFTSADGENTVTFKDVSVSDATPDQFEIWFADNTACTTHKVATYTKPVVPVISVAAPTFDNKDCDKDTYTLKAVVTYTNQNGTLYAWLDNDAANKKAFDYNKDKTTSDTVTIVLPNLVGDGAAHQLNIEFDGPKGCRKIIEDNNAIPFTAPFTPVISGVTITPDTMKCGETAYKVTVAATLSANAIGKTLTVTGDTGESPTTYTVASTSFSHQFTVNKEDATGKFRIYFADAENCESQKTKDYTYTVPTIPNLSINTVTAPAPACDVTTFDLSISGTYSNLHGNQLEFWWDEVKKTTQSIAPLSSGKVAATISGVVYDGKTHKLEVKSSNTEYDNCPEEQNIIVPFSPSISKMEATVQPYTCGDKKYQVKVEVPFTNGQGHDLIIEDWNGKKQSIPTTEEDTKKEYMFEYAWEAPTTHEFKAYFVGAEKCDDHKAAFEVPLWHHIDAVTVASDATVPCNDPTFNAVVTVKATYDITGQDLVLTYDDNGAKDTIVTATGKSTEVPLKLHTIEGPDQTVTVAFKDDPTCDKTSDAFTPAKRAGCHKDPATICEGDTYTWFGQDYTRPVGLDTITHGYDSLFLTVKAKPHITLHTIDLACEDVASIALPYTVDKGEPNTFALTVDGVAQTIIGVTATDILIPSFEPGPHHAKVTVGVEGIACEDSAEVDFTVAIANQVYSKWTDVLFVNNKDERYTAYQWFADNKSMDGETQQRLYDPNGLSGNNVIYFCQLTTTDGKTFFTCPQAFDDVTPSRTQDTGEKKVQSTRIYDNMGRSISGTPNNGMYIIVEQLEDGDTRVRKIAVYE